eukprot:CAMPEP_0198132176 /NCGR_PEP_ID=MMETSP1442-20131203/57727_1 /TAXON_ID= /ORGANISM="Craspedostauros australis, Strain CCMP3328" /LENGTH=54 /DNA_ID=CAMNT_0043793117 /DNA_START=89 /DNA_END=249 /DNA_ORIENTATION=-
MPSSAPSSAAPHSGSSITQRFGKKRGTGASNNGNIPSGGVGTVTSMQGGVQGGV